MKQFTFEELKKKTIFPPSTIKVMDELIKQIIWMRENKCYQLWRLNELNKTWVGKHINFRIEVKDENKYTHNKIVTIKAYNYLTDSKSTLKRSIVFE